MINLSQQIHKRMLPKGFIKRLNMLIGSKAFSKFIYRKIKNKQTKNQKETHQQYSNCEDFWKTARDIFIFSIRKSPKSRALMNRVKYSHSKIQCPLLVRLYFTAVWRCYPHPEINGLIAPVNRAGAFTVAWINGSIIKQRDACYRGHSLCRVKKGEMKSFLVQEEWKKTLCH